MGKILEVTNLEKHYEDFCLDKISFDINRGSIMGYIGPNGSGKTTTIKALLNVIKIDGGKIKLFEEEFSKAQNSIKQKIGFVIGDNAFYEFLTAIDMAKIISKFYSKWDWKVFNKLMLEFELNQNRKIESYSKGMKIKYMIACAMSHDAELFILDEPTSGLDPVFRSELMEIFQSLISDSKRSILFSTHITSDLDNIADFITFIYKGQIVFSNSKEFILDTYSVINGAQEQRDSVLKTGKTNGIIDSNSGFTALTNQKDYFIKQFGNGLTVEKATLEDIMVHTVRGNKNDKFTI